VMRTRKRMKTDPNTVLSNAIYMGLVALIRLARNRTSKKTRRYYNSIEKMWQKARAAYENQNKRYRDFLLIQNAEPNMRGQFLKFVWSSTRRFGNRETKRAYSWLEGSVGTLNSLLNYAGARLRDLAMTLYPFPEPVKFEVRKYSDGSKETFTMKEAEKIKNDGAIKTYYKFGFERKGKLPRVCLSHPTLAGLDFVDMIRAHCVELCRQCFIYEVPMTEAHRYIRLLIHQLKPFLEWVYSGGKRGRNNFNPNADAELRKIVLEIRSLYQKRSKTRKRISHKNQVGLEPTIELVKKKAEAEKKKTTDPYEIEALQKILDHIDTEDIVVRDIEKLVEQVQEFNKRAGNEWHRVLLSDLHHPVSLKQVVSFGDKLLDTPSSVLIVAELPVANHSGKVDLTIFIRRELARKGIWTPVMVLEVKTKAGFNFNLFGMHIKRKRESAVTPAFYAWKRALDDNEWNSIITSGPDSSAVSQLNEYTHALLSEYKQLVPHDSNHPTSLWKGVIVLDSDQDASDVFPAFQYLLDDLTTGLVNQLVQQDAISITPEPLNSGLADPRIGLLVAPSSGPDELLNEMTVPTLLPEDNPFAERAPDDRTLTLYVPIDSPTSSGKTAARLSTNWHLLHHIKECIDISPDHTKTIWLDLIGDHGSKELVEKRFGIRKLFHENKISTKTYDQLTNTLRDIKFINLSSLVSGIFKNRANAFDRLFKHLQFLIPNDSQSKRIIVLDGWIELKDMVPKHQQNLLLDLEQKLLDTLPDSNVEIIWIDNGTPHTRMNKSYQRKCVSPLWYESPRKTHIDEIIYNVPTSPWSFGWTLPQQEDVRIIIQDVQAQVEPWKVAMQVPQLTGFADKFRGLSKRQRTYTLEEVERYTSDVHKMHNRGVSLSSTYASAGRLTGNTYDEVLEDALTLVPSTLRRREVEEPSIEISWKTTSNPVSSRYGPTLKERTSLDITRPPPVPVRGEPQYAVAKEITRRWYYKKTPTQLYFDESEVYVSTSPPVINELKGGLLDTVETRERELRRLLYAAKYLKEQLFVSAKVKKLCKKIEKFCMKQFALVREHPSLRNPEFFLESLKEVKGFILGDTKVTEVWKHLAPIRKGLVELLNSENREVIVEISRDTTDLLLLYGNNLFLAVVVALENRDLSIAERLWNSIAEWIFYQLGMDIQDDEVKWVYSFQAILSGLITRANALSQIDIPERVTLQEEVGAVIWEQSRNGYNALLLIPQESGFVTALVEGLRETRFLSNWYSSVTKPQRLKNMARENLTSLHRTPLISTTVLGEQVLWLPLMDADQNVLWESFSLEIAKPSGRHNVIPWFKLEEAPLLVHPSSLPTIPESVDAALRKLARVKQKRVPVKLIVRVDSELEVFTVNLEGEGTDENLEFTRTNDLVRFLRYNIRIGSGYLLNETTVTTWELDDISYGDSLVFLKPIVHRSRFYPDEYHYPKTCKEYLTASTGKGITMVLRQEGSQYCVELEDLSHGSFLKALEDVTFDFYALVLLTDCDRLYDPRHRIWHPVSLDVTSILHKTKLSKKFEHTPLMDALETAYESYIDMTLLEPSSDDTGKVDEVFHPRFRGVISKTSDGYLLSIKCINVDGPSDYGKTYPFPRDDIEEIIIQLEIKESELSSYKMENEVSAILNALKAGEELPEMEVEDDLGEEREFQGVIAEYREEVKEDSSKYKYLGETLVQFARYYHELGKRRKAHSLLEEGIVCFRKCDMNELSVCRNLADSLMQRIEWQNENKDEDTKNFQDDLKEIQELLQPLRSASSYKEFVEQLNERILKVRS